MSSEASGADGALSEPKSLPVETNDVRRQVEQEQALIDAHRKVSSLEEEIEKLKKEKGASDLAQEDSCNYIPWQGP